MVPFCRTQVSIVSLKKSGMQVRSHAWDRNTGGRDFDEALFEHFCDEFKTKNKIDIRNNKKASFKLRQGIEKVRPQQERVARINGLKGWNSWGGRLFDRVGR